jgi:DNA-binding GntR family transcriptional regulator
MDIASALRQGDPERCNKLLAEHVDDAHSRLTTPLPLVALSETSSLAGIN